MADGRAKRPKDKKSALAGSGGNNRRRLQGKGPTSKAEDRVYHPAHKRKLAAEAARWEQARLEKANRLRPELSLAPGHELVAGRNAVLEAVRSGIPLSHVFVSGGVASDERLGEVVRTATALGVPLFEVSCTELDRMIDGTVHQGVAIEVPPYEYADVEDFAERAGKGAHVGKPGPVVAFDLVADPHNLDAVMRLASALSTDGAVMLERRSAGVNTTVWKVSAGAAARIPAARMPSLVAALGKLKTRGYFAARLDGHGNTVIEDISFVDAPIMLVTGSESKGLARFTRKTYDTIASVPIAAELEPFNTAAATGIMLYQIDRF